MNLVRKEINCPAMFSNPLYDMPAERWPPPSEIPLAFLSDYTMDGKVAVGKFYLNHRYAGGSASDSDWSKEKIDEWILRAQQGLLEGTYGTGDTNNVYRACVSLHATELSVQGRHMLVVGSENPWLEAVLLACGAAKVTTVEYGKIKSTHPQIATMTPWELNERFLSGDLEPFQGAASFSSVEHSGLGRYGDLLNPWGDLIAVARVWCITTPSAPFLFGTMSGPHDSVEWNAHRVYAPKGAGRYSQLMANWELASEPGQFPSATSQELFIFRRVEG